MLIRLMYVSTTIERMELDKFKELLAQSQNNNQRRDLTGMLAFNNSIFLQVLEGDREVINTLYYKLLQDPRHHKVVLMSCYEITQRHWGQWSMGFAAPKAENRALFLKYSHQSIFNPYGMGAEAAEKMLMELSHTAAALQTQTAKPAATVAHASVVPGHAATEAVSTVPAALDVASATVAGVDSQVGNIFSRFLKK